MILFMCIQIFAVALQPPYLKVDFNRWKDEDDSDYEESLNEPNLEDVSY